MKNLVLVICLSLSAFANATEVTIYDHRELSTNFTDGAFVINESLGRAWVELTFNDNDPESTSDTYRVQVRGMSFDPQTNEVIIQDENGRVACALVKKQIFGVVRIRPTGNCEFVKKRYSVNSDNGFEIERINKVKINLVY